jgi:integrase
MLQSGRRFKIGRYGDITLAQAREAAARLKAEKTLGRIMPAAVSLTQARQEYLDQLNIREATRSYYERNLNRLKANKLSDITPLDINHILDRLPRTSRDQSLASLRPFFKWCVRRHYLEKSPCELMQLSQSISRSRLVTDDELRAIWRACEQATAKSPPLGPDGGRRLPASFCTIVKLLILTGQRRSEIAALQTSWVKADTITLPKERSRRTGENIPSPSALRLPHWYQERFAIRRTAGFCSPPGEDPRPPSTAGQRAKPHSMNFPASRTGRCTIFADTSPRPMRRSGLRSTSPKNS